MIGWASPGTGLAVDATGNVFVSGTDSDNVFKIPLSDPIEEIIDASGDGAGNPLDRPWGITTDASENVYVAGLDSDNVFRITPGGLIAEIIDATGDAAGNPLESPADVVVDSLGNVFVAGFGSDRRRTDRSWPRR